ncbi:MAG: RlmE family RNA methyltransferase [Hyphomicrobium sp.]
MATKSTKSGRAGSGRGEGPGGGQRLLHRRVKSKASRSESSRAWLERQLNDPYVAAARQQGFRSRAAFKLQEIDDKHRVLKPGMAVIDLGAAPGGWSQIAAQRVRALDGAAGQRGQVVAIDYLGMEPLPGVDILELDFLDPSAEAELKSRLKSGSADVVLSDMAAPTTGHTKTDHLRIMGLAETAAHFACDVLKPGGTFLCKVFQGGTERELLELLKRSFASVRHIKPPASRAESAELYVLASGFRGTPALPD